MKVRVRMLAFEERTQNGLSVKIREVDVPNEKMTGDPDHDLEQVFYYGQNDFQPQPCCSVSAGDVIEYAESLWLVCSAGFRRVTEDEYLALKRYEQRGLSLHPLVTGRDDEQELAKRMFEKGYRFRLAPRCQTFAPLYQKDVAGVAKVMREDYPDVRFEIAWFQSDGTLVEFPQVTDTNQRSAGNP